MQKLLLSFILISIFYNLSIANCLQGNCMNGKGTLLYNDRTKYTGSFLNSKPHGEGKLILPDGSIYEGSFFNGFRHGKGIYKYSSGDVYEGDFEKNIISGIGKVVYRNGDSYTGEWLNGKSSGKGKYTFSDGETYEGDFLDGEFSGKGIFTRNDGTYYDGEWFRNKKHGKGILKDKRGKRVQYFDMNKLVKDEHITQTNTVVANDSYNNIASTKDCTKKYCHQEDGFYTYGDGSIYTGGFINGQGQGQGICTYANGDRYEGGWKNHAPHGNGTLYFKSGNKYSAIWENGKPIQKTNEVGKYTNVSKNQQKPSFTPSTAQNMGDTKVFALIVGVATYQHMPSLKYTDDDAYQLYAFLKSPEGGAIPDHQIKIMIDDGATHQTIKKELKQLAYMADGNDVILLYMSGHGVDGAYAPGDFDGHKNHLPYDEILAELNISKAKHKLFIADACHSGSMMASARSPQNISMENFYNAYNAAESGTAILMSSKKDEVSLEYGGLRQGVFSHFLIKGLKGNADTNKDKLVTINELYSYISSQVRSYTNHAQSPSITGDFDKNMPVAMIR